MTSSGTSSQQPDDEALIKEAHEIRLKHESFEKALGRAIRHHYNGKEAYEVYIKLISKFRDSVKEKI
jgi:hypothetical protein